MASKTEKKLKAQGEFLAELVSKLGDKKRAKKIAEEHRQKAKRVSKRGGQ